MKYLLIDTNGWMEVLQSDAKDKVIDYLNHWKTIGAIEILIPEIILNKEWPVITSKYRSRTKDAHNTTAASMSDDGGRIPDMIRKSNEYIENRINQVEEIINRGVVIKESTQVIAAMRKRQIKKLAPFHNKTANFDDAMIYFSTVEWLKKKNIAMFVFVSTNTTDFSKDKQQYKDLLHADLKTPGLDTEYCTNIQYAMHVLKEALPVLPEGGRSKDRDYTGIYFVTKNIQELLLLDQIHTALDCYNDQLPFLPLGILMRLFPFKIDNLKQDYTHYSAYFLTVNNPALMTLLGSIAINKKNKVHFSNKTFIKRVKRPAGKIFEVYSRLSSNLVRAIHSGSDDQVNIQINKKGICNCIQCRYIRFDFNGVLSLAGYESYPDIMETMKNGYVAFLLGNFQTAFHLYYDAYTKAKALRKDISAYICLYSLKKVKDFAHGYFRKHDGALKELYAGIDAIFTPEEIAGYADQSDFARENINWVKEDRFYLEAALRIFLVIEDIRNHYYNQIKGGWSDNANLRLLYSHFSELENYLDNNHLCFNFENTSHLFTTVLDGLLMCYSFNNKQGSRLEYFNEYIISRALRYCKASEMLDLFRRYDIQNLHYIKTASKTFHLETIAREFFQSYTSLQEQVKTKLDGEGYFFNEKIYQTVLGLITLYAYVDVDTKTITTFTESVLLMCNKGGFFRKFDPKYFGEFIAKKGRYIKRKVFIELLHTAIEQDELHDHAIFSALRQVIQKFHRTTVIAEEKLYAVIVQTFLNKCPKCNEYHHKQFLFDIYMMLSPALQQDMGKKLAGLLSQKFDAEDYYTWSIFDMIDYKIYFKQYLQIFINTPRKHAAVIWPETKRENVLHDFNNLLNLIFKHNLPIDKSIGIVYKGFNHYYDWLLDMEGFDYSLFDPLWVLLYGSSSYLKKIFSVEKVKKAVRDYLKLRPHPVLSDYYITYTTANAILKDRIVRFKN